MTQECVLKSEVSCILHLKYKSVHICVQVMAIWTCTQSCKRNIWPPLYPQIPLQGIHFHLGNRPCDIQVWEGKLTISLELRSQKTSQDDNKILTFCELVEKNVHLANINDSFKSKERQVIKISNVWKSKMLQQGSAVVKRWFLDL